MPISPRETLLFTFLSDLFSTLDSGVKVALEQRGLSSLEMMCDVSKME